MGLDDVERSDVTIEELRAFSLFFDLEAEVLGAEVDRIVDLVLRVRSSMLVCLRGLSRLGHYMTILREGYGLVDAFEELCDGREFR